MAADNNTSSIANGNIGTVLAVGVRFIGDGGCSQFTDLGGRAATAIDCQFDGGLDMSSSAGIGITRKFYNSSAHGGINIGNLVQAYWVGGVIGETSPSSTITVSGSGNLAMAAAIFNSLVISSSGTSPIAIANVGGAGNGVTVTATVPPVLITGDFTDATFTGTPAAMRKFDGSTGSMDFTGPGYMNTVNKSGSFGSKVVLRGTGVSAHVLMKAGVALQGIGLIDSYVQCDFTQASTYSFDATSARVVAVLTGTNLSGFGSKVNLGNKVRIITEDYDTLLGTIISSGSFTGPQGPPGEDGLDGPPGDRGTKGDAGAAGAKGDKGDKGDAGSQGIPGPPGDEGDVGPQGYPGNKGDKGDTGLTGAKGDKGDAGPQGIPGTDGLDGLDGSDGAPGSPGAKGDKGDKGDTGLPGSGGSSITTPPGDIYNDDDDPYPEFIPPDAPFAGMNVPVGITVIWPFTVAPLGWMLCQGGTIKRSEPLGAKLVADGALWGTGDGSTTVNVPDLQERFPLGKGGTHAVGATGGGSHTHTQAQMGIPALTASPHALTSAWAAITGIATAFIAYQRGSFGSWTDTHISTVSSAATASSSGRTTGVQVKGTTDGGVTVASATNTTPQTGGPSTGTSPVDQFATVNYIIKL